MTQSLHLGLIGTQVALFHFTWLAGLFKKGNDFEDKELILTTSRKLVYSQGPCAQTNPLPPLSSTSFFGKSAIWTPSTVGVNGSAGLHKTGRDAAFIIHQAVHSTPLDYLHTLL